MMRSQLTPLGPRKPPRQQPVAITPAERDLETERLVLEQERIAFEQERAAFEQHVPPSTAELARMVIAAGRKRRAEYSDKPELPEHPAARAIVLVGQRRRNEISAKDNQWLSDYLRHQERK